MRKFRFTMESALRLREHQEHQALEQLAGAIGDHAAAQQRLEDTVKQVADTIVRTGHDVHQKVALTAFLCRMDEISLQQQFELAQAQDAVAAATDQARHAQAARKGIEKVKERQLERWQIEASREEDRVLNEAALTRKGTQR